MRLYWQGLIGCKLQPLSEELCGMFIRCTLMENDVEDKKKVVTEDLIKFMDTQFSSQIMLGRLRFLIRFLLS